MSVTFAPELREAVREAADEAGLSLSEWLSRAAEAKLNADRDAGILAEVIDITVEPITRQDGMRAGELLGRTRLRDAIDASVALLARPGDRILTSDPQDLRALCDAAGTNAVVVDC